MRLTGKGAWGFRRTGRRDPGLAGGFGWGFRAAFDVGVLHPGLILSCSGSELRDGESRGPDRGFERARDQSGSLHCKCDVVMHTSRTDQAARPARVSKPKGVVGLSRLGAAVTDRVARAWTVAIVSTAIAKT